MALGEQLKVIFLLNSTNDAANDFVSSIQRSEYVCFNLFISTFHWISALCTWKKGLNFYTFEKFIFHSHLSFIVFNWFRLTYFSVQYLYELPYHLPSQFTVHSSQRQLNWLYFGVKIFFIYSTFWYFWFLYRSEWKKIQERTSTYFVWSFFVPEYIMLLLSKRVQKFPHSVWHKDHQLNYNNFN